MYKFKSERKKEYLSGETITNVCKMLFISRQQLTNILNGKCATTQRTANSIVKLCDLKLEDYFELV